MTDLSALRAAAYAAADAATKDDDSFLINVKTELSEMVRLGMVSKKIAAKALKRAPEYRNSDLGVSELCDLLIDVARIR